MEYCLVHGRNMEPDFDAQFESIMKDNGMDESFQFSLEELSSLLSDMAEAMMWLAGLLSAEIMAETAAEDCIDMDDDVIITMKNLRDACQSLSTVLSEKDFEEEDEDEDDGDEDF